jgi:DNA-directed RNA polymerase sigma subunit (sigma70/sigma32)
VADQGRTIRLPVHLVEQVTRFLAAEAQLQQTLGRCPADLDVAGALNISLEKVQQLRAAAGQNPESLDAPLTEDEELTLGSRVPTTLPEGDPAALVTQQLLRRDVQRLLDTVLTTREQQVIRLRFGLDDGHERTLAEVAALLGGLSRERVRQIEGDALTRLRTTRRLGRLGSYLD